MDAPPPPQEAAQSPECPTVQDKQIHLPPPPAASVLGTHGDSERVWPAGGQEAEPEPEQLIYRLMSRGASSSTGRIRFFRRTR